MHKAKIASIEADIKRLFGFTDRENESGWVQWEKGAAARDTLLQLLRDYRAEVQKNTPDEAQLHKLDQRLKEAGDAFSVSSAWGPDWEFSQYKGNPLDDSEVKAAMAGGNKNEIFAQIDRKIQFFARFGDPLIQVSAPRDARKVVALFPDGQVKELAWNDLTRRFEARFDIPEYTSEGAYSVQIVVVTQSGERKNITVRFQVDLSSPSNRATLKFDPQNPRLELECDAQTDRVSAFLASGERVELRRQSDGIWSAPIPANARSGQKVRFVLTDAAHNRTEIALDLGAENAK